MNNFEETENNLNDVPVPWNCEIDAVCEHCYFQIESDVL